MDLNDNAMDGNGLGWKLLGPSLMIDHEEIERELVISGFD
jgi:hypothetical protein